MSNTAKTIPFFIFLYISFNPCYAGVSYITSVTPSSSSYGVQQYSNYFAPIVYDSNYESNFQSTVSDQNVHQNEENENNSTERKYFNSSEIPLELINKINEYSSIDEILENLVDDYEKEQPSIASRFGDTDYDEEERSAAIKPKTAMCQPIMTTVKLIESDDPSVVYLPSCTRIEQCDGCCTHPLLSCQPTETEIVNFVVRKCQYSGGNKLKYVGKEIVVKERHLKCKCNCKQQAKDCKGFRQYNPNTCSCSCPNRDERQKCLKEADKKLWNPKICACQCRDQSPCSSDQKFDQHKCQCVLNLQRRNVQGKQYSYNGNPEFYSPQTALVPYQ